VTKYLIRRVLSSVPLIFGISTIIFFVVNAAPGDPMDTLLRPGMTAESAEQMRINFGLDRPVHVRYAKWLTSTLRGDFGNSITHGRPVLDVIRDLLPNTLLLSASALLLSLFFGVLLGAIQAVRQYSLLDSTLSVGLLFFYSMPSFWLALMLMLTLSYMAGTVWDWPFSFPVSAMYGSEYEFLSLGDKVVERIRYLFLPTLSLALVLTAGIARYMRSSMLEVIRQDFIRTARAKGLPERTVIFKHALRNSLIPIVTILGLYIPVLFSGTVLIENVFAWPGMGRAMVQAIGQRDYAMVMGGSFFFATFVVLGNLLADTLYAVVDPRIRYD
jgi:peptide/nickel transport system permease protein